MSRCRDFDDRLGTILPAETPRGEWQTRQMSVLTAAEALAASLTALRLAAAGLETDRRHRSASKPR